MNEALVETSILVVVFSHSVLASSLRPHGLQHNQISLSFAISQSLLKLTSFKPVRLSNHLILCHPLLLLPSIFPSIQVFSHESAFCIRWPKYWSFSFKISCSNEHSGLISYRIDWFDLLIVQGTQSLLQHHSSKASVLRHSAFFVVQISHPYVTMGKTTVLTKRSFVGKVMSLFFNKLFRFLIALLSRSKYLLISLLQSWCTVILYIQYWGGIWAIYIIYIYNIEGGVWAF